MPNKLMILGSNRKKVELHCSAVKGHVWKESGVTQGRREVEVGILLLSSYENNVFAKNMWSYF